MSNLPFVQNLDLDNWFNSMIVNIPVNTILLMVIMIWMFALRISAAGAMKLDMQDAAHVKNVNWPTNVAQVSENYAHLFEQPVLFYATAITIAVMGHGDSVAVNAAWAFVVLRVFHSLIQCTFNNVTLRFVVFLASWAALLVMIIREAMLLF